MAPFFPVFVRRSDGQTATSKSSATQEPNAPLPQQLDTTPNDQGICDFYRECHPTDSKEVEWRRKLGGMLMRELDPAQFKDKHFILAALPYNYVLFEHVRYKVSESNETTQKPTKSHAAGSNERQDAYLYGHPQGRKKRYRSPAEFFPHLLWLAIDEQGDPNNCTCKFCSPEEIETEEKQAAPTKDVKQSMVKQDSGSPAPNPLPRFRSKEQSLDAIYNKFLFRPGELIWFQRDRTSWGLGAIISRKENPANPALGRYRVQPLSHPLAHRPSTTCTQNELRAWLAWSPPPCLNPYLNPHSGNNMASPTYQTVDWQWHLNAGMSEKTAEIDGSILIAKFVETTYTLFGRLESKTSTRESGQTSEIRYNGLFFGAEKIWVGDPLRLRSPKSSDMMVLHSIVERSLPEDPVNSRVVLEGDIYSLVTEAADSSDLAKDTAHLPVRVQQDLNARNAIARQAPDPSKRVQSYWQLEAKSAQRSFTDIKGRWYESSLLMPILSPAEYEAGRQRGELGDASLWMNGQGDCNKPQDASHGAFRAADTKIKKREDAFGQAVPASFRISKGLDDPTAANADLESSTSNKPAQAEKSAHAPPSTHQRPLQTQQNLIQPSQSQAMAAAPQTQILQSVSEQNSNQDASRLERDQSSEARPTGSEPAEHQHPPEPNQELTFEEDLDDSNVDQYMNFEHA